MKKCCIFSALLILSTTFEGFSQKGVEFGVRFMPQSTWLMNKNDFDEAGARLSHDMTWGTVFGIETGFNFTDNFGIRTNFLLATQGQKNYGELNASPNRDAYSYNVATQMLVTGDILDPEYTSEVQLRYFQIPLFLKFNSSPGDGAFFSFLIGPQFNFMSRARHFLNGNEVIYSKSSNLLGTQGLDFDTDDLYNSTTLGVAMGFGGDIIITDELMFNFNFRFAYDLQDIENKGFTDPALLPVNTAFNMDDPSLHNSNYWGDGRDATTNLTGGIMFGLTYVLPL